VSVPRKYRPGQRRLSAGQLNDQIDQVQALANLQVTGNATFQREGGTYTLNVPGSSEGFWARIDGEAGSPDFGMYAWTEMELLSDGSYGVLSGGRSGTTSENPLEEVNLKSGVVSGSIVWVFGGEPELGGSATVLDHFKFLAGAGAVVVTVVDTVHVTAASVGSPTVYTARRVEWSNSVPGPGFIESSPTVSYTTVYESQDRALKLDAGGAGTLASHALPLFKDSNGVYYVNLDQFADATDTTVSADGVPGILSAGPLEQEINGPKWFRGAVRVNTDRSNYAGDPDSSAFTVLNDVDSSCAWMVRCLPLASDFAGQNTVAIGDVSTVYSSDPTNGVNLRVGGFGVFNGGVTFQSWDVDTTPVAHSGSISHISSGSGVTSTDEVLDSVASFVAGWGPSGYKFIATRSGTPVSYFDIYDNGLATDLAYSVAGVPGLSTTLTFDSTVSGSCATATFTGGILTSATYVP
jgi:hypothetical protein